VPRDSLVSGSQWYWWRGRIEREVGPGRQVMVPQPGDPNTRVGRYVQDTSYRAHDAIEVRLRDLTKVGSAIDSALAHGVTSISPIRFVGTDIVEAQEAALREATQRARRQAQAIAEAGGGQLGRTLALSTERDYNPYRDDWVGLSTAGASVEQGREEGPGTQVIQPSIAVRVTVYGRWELLGRP